MSSHRQIGQLLIIGFDDTEMTPRLSSLLTRLQPAGVILFARNIKSAEQTWRLLCDCQECVSTPLFTCVDVESASVDRFRDVVGPTPSAADGLLLLPGTNQVVAFMGPAGLPPPPPAS